MKKEYDFSQAGRGKFYRGDVVPDIPIYLEPDVAEVVSERARPKKARAASQGHPRGRQASRLEVIIPVDISGAMHREPISHSYAVRNRALRAVRKVQKD